MPEKKSKFTAELGASGTSKYHGVIDEDYNSDLKFPGNLEIYDKMRKGDATVRSALMACKLPILSAKYGFTAASEDARDVEIKEFCEWVFFDKILWRHFLYHQLLAFDFGFMFTEKVYAQDEGKIYFLKLAPRLPKSITKLETSTGEEGIEQQAYKDNAFSRVSIPKEKLFHFSIDQEGGNLEGISVLRSSYKHWYYKENLYKIQAISIERTGVGVPVATFEKIPTAEEENQAKETLENIRANEESYVIEKGGVKFRFEVPGRVGGQSDSVGPIEHHDRQILKSVLAQFINLGVTKGAMSLSEDHSNLFFLSLKATAESLVEKIQRELVREIVDLNYDNVENYPTLTVSEIGTIDSDAMSNAIQRYVQSGLITPDAATEDYIRVIMSLPAIAAEVRDEIIEKKKKEKDDIGKKIDDEKKAKEKEEEKPMPAPKEKEKEKSKDKMSMHFAEDYWRRLTLAEERVDFAKMSKIFSTGEDAIERILTRHSSSIREDFKKGLEEFLKTGSEKAVSYEALGGAVKVTALQRDLEEEMMKLYEKGKMQAAKELGVKWEKTPAEDKRLIALEADSIATKHVQDIRNEMVLAAQESIRQKAQDEAIISAAVSAMLQKAESQIPATIGILTVGSVNQGIGTVFDNFGDMIYGYQFSAILDDKTTDLCLSLDGRVTQKKDELPNPPVHWNCFTAGHQVETEQGGKNIEEIKVGDNVLTHEGRFCEVYDILSRDIDEEIIEIEMENGVILECTLDHPILVGEEWIEAKNLQVGDYLTQIKDYLTQLIRIVSIRQRHFSGKVFNLSVAGDESYTVNGIVVHNCRSRLVAILKDQTIKPPVTGVPESLKEHIGAGFWDATQPKTPLLLKNAPGIKVVEQEIKERQAKVEEYKAQGLYPDRIEQHEKVINRLLRSINK